MYRGRLWTMRQYAGFGSAAETNQRFRYLLAQGQTGLSRRLRPADADGLRRRRAGWRGARSGKVGVAISSVDDMAELFAAIPLDRVSTSMTINATAAILLCALHGGGRAPGRVAAATLSGTVQNDILKEYIARGTYIFPPGAVACG